MKRFINIVAIVIATVCAICTVCGCGQKQFDTDWEFVESLIKEENLEIVEGIYIPIIEEGDAEIVKKIFYWVKDNKNTKWSSIEFWTEDNSRILELSKELCDKVKNDKRKVGLYTQKFQNGTIIRFNSNTIRVEKWTFDKFANHGIRTKEQFLKLNPGTDISKPLTGESYIF